MGRQFRFYLLPADIERVVAMLRERFGARFLESASTSQSPLEAGSVFQTSEAGTTSVNCYLTMAGNSATRTWYAKRQQWLVDTDSEIIEFSGCYFEPTVLQIGRFYYQTDFVVGNEFRDKRPEFVHWAEQLFRATKKQLTYSPAIMAYVGEEAQRWRASGGRFASFRRGDGTYIFEQD